MHLIRMTSKSLRFSAERCRSNGKAGVSRKPPKVPLELEEVGVLSPTVLATGLALVRIGRAVQYRLPCGPRQDWLLLL